MPRYDYFCESNGRTIEVTHSMTRRIKDWGELCDLAEIDPEHTPKDVAVHRIITTAPMANIANGNAYLKDHGFTKLEKRCDGTYENVTRTGTEERFINPKDPKSLPHLYKKIRD